MIWKKITIETTTEAVDMISYTLGELGVEGIEVEDKVPLSEEDKQAMFIDILPDLPPDDGVALVSCYVDHPDADADVLVEQIRQSLEQLRSFMEIGTGRLTVSETQDEDWINKWKEYFHPFRLGRIVIKPTWIPVTEVTLQPEDVLVEIDPKTAFGTGSHETTKLCILQMERYLHKNAEVLDVGCGSGILSVIALKLGAGQVFGVDIDPLAVETSYENLKANHLTETQAGFMQGDLIHDAEFASSIQKQYDVVVANILTEVILPLTEIIRPFLKPDGIFITSGILDVKAESVCDALTRNGFEILETTHMKDWVSITAKPSAIIGKPTSGQ